MAGALRQTVIGFLLLLPVCTGITSADIVRGSAFNDEPNVADGWKHLTSARGELPQPVSGSQQTASLLVDVDSDGIDDIVIAERTASPSVVWLRRTAGGWSRYLIESERLRIEAGGATHDIDGDGDLDIVFGGDTGSPEIWWWENPSPTFAATRPWRRHLVKTSGANKHHDMVFGDFDGDGQAELVFWNQHARSLVHAHIPVNPRTSAPWPSTVIYRWERDHEHEGLAAADIDGDGQIDIVGGGNWYRHERGERFSVHPVDPAMRFTRTAVGQLIEGGHPEIVFGPGDANGPLQWYAWNGKRWTARMLEASIVHGHSLQLGDVDGDGHLDIFIAEMARWAPAGSNPGARMLLYFGNGRGDFVRQIVATGFGNHESRLGDLDGDGDLDILAKPYAWKAPRVDVFINGGTAGRPRAQSALSLDRWRRHLIGEMPARAVFVTAADLDGDRRTDIAAGGWWWKQPPATEATWERRAIGPPLHNLAVVSDFDGDGALDVLGTRGEGASANAEFVWARNAGNGRFTVLENVASGEGDFLQGVAAERFTDGGPVEIALSWHSSVSGVQMLTVPPEPTRAHWQWRTISSATQDEDLSAGDIDGDGDLDLLLGTVWLENPGPGAGAWMSHAIGRVTAGVPDRSDLADIDGDGRLDAVVGLEGGHDVLWFRAGEDPRRPWTRLVVGTDVGGGFSMDCADMDLDGDVDVVLGEHRGDPNRVIIYENQGWGTRWTPHVVDTGRRSDIDHHDGTQVVDIDDDGDPDIVSIGWYNPRVWLYENLATDTGDTLP